MTTLEEVTTYNGRSPDRRRPPGPSDSTIRLYDLMASRPDGVTLDDAAEHLALGFPTDHYRAYEQYRRKHYVGKRFSDMVFGDPQFKSKAHRWHASLVLGRMVRTGTARHEGNRWFAGRPPRVTDATGRRHYYVAGSDPAATAERIQAINVITVLRRIQRRLRSRDEIEAIDYAIRNMGRAGNAGGVP